MDNLEDETAEIFRLGYDLAVELLLNIDLARSAGIYTEADIAEVEAERDRCKAWLDDYEARRKT